MICKMRIEPLQMEMVLHIYPSVVQHSHIAIWKIILYLQMHISLESIYLLKWAIVHCYVMYPVDIQWMEEILHHLGLLKPYQ